MTPSIAPEQSPEINRSGLQTSPIDRYIPILIFVFSFAYLAAFVRHSSLEPDEGIVLEGAQRILDGQIPYKDFFTFYTPGSFYLIAIVFKIFGNSFVVARLSLAVAGAACSLLAYLIAKRTCSHGFAVFVALLTTTAGFAYRFLVLHNWYSTLLAVLALYTLVRWLENSRPSWAFATGSFCSLTLMFEQSKGAGLILGVMMAVLAVKLAQVKLPITQADTIGSAAGIVWPVALTVLYFAAHGAVGVMIEDLLWPLRHYTTANHVPYGYQNWSPHSRELIFHAGPAWAIAVKVVAVSPGLIVPFLPLSAIGLLVYWIRQGRSGRASLRYSAQHLSVCSVVTGLLISVIAVRADNIHFMYLAPFWYIPLAWILEGSAFRSKFLHTISPLLVLLVALTFGLMSLALLVTATGAHNRVATRRGDIKTGKPDTVISFVVDHTAAGQKILVYPYLPLYYYLTGTRSAAPLDYFQPGMNTAAQAKEVISSLENGNVQALLYEPSFAENIATSWPGTPMTTIADDSIGNYIAGHYRVCADLNSPSGSKFQFMVPNSAHCP